MSLTFDATKGPVACLQTYTSKSVFNLAWDFDASNFKTYSADDNGNPVYTPCTDGVAPNEIVGLVRIPPKSLVIAGTVTLVSGQNSVEETTEVTGQENPKFSIGDADDENEFYTDINAEPTAEGTTVLANFPKAYPEGGYLVLKNISASLDEETAATLGYGSADGEYIYLTGNLYCLPME